VPALFEAHRSRDREAVKKTNLSRRLTQMNADNTFVFNRRLSVFIGGLHFFHTF
jgi:hypothetical protein